MDDLVKTLSDVLEEIQKHAKEEKKKRRNLHLQ